jgi:dephospho-CoA kinase
LDFVMPACGGQESSPILAGVKRGGWLSGAKVVHRSKPIIGLCGGIGAGKTRVAAAFADLGCLVISSDQLNHEILCRPDVLATLREWWGDEVEADGGPDRRRIAEIVFADPAQKQRLEGLVYPLIAQRRAAMIETVEDNSALKAIVIDSPLLLESNLDRECDTVVFVDASAARRMERLRQERGWNTEELHRRERWQTPLSEKRLRADYVIDNDGAGERIRPQANDILRKILARFAV